MYWVYPVETNLVILPVIFVADGQYRSSLQRKTLLAYDQVQPYCFSSLKFQVFCLLSWRVTKKDALRWRQNGQENDHRRRNNSLKRSLTDDNPRWRENSRDFIGRLPKIFCPWINCTTFTTWETRQLLSSCIVFGSFVTVRSSVDVTMATDSVARQQCPH